VQASGVERKDRGLGAAGPVEAAHDAGRAAASAKGGATDAHVRRTDADGVRFRALLRPRKAARGAEGPPCGAGAASASARFPLLAAPVREVSVRALAPRPEVARVLVGQAQRAQEAHVELRGGVFAGTSIHLVAGAGEVEVRLSAPTEAARLALAGVIDRVGLQLRSRGIVVRPGASADTGSRQRQRDNRGGQGG